VKIESSDQPNNFYKPNASPYLSEFSSAKRLPKPFVDKRGQYCKHPKRTGTKGQINPGLRKTHQIARGENLEWRVMKGFYLSHLSDNLIMDPFERVREKER
jgi:hypothetical protein